MLSNYVTVAMRTLRRYKGTTLINVTGLAAGMACCLLIVLYVQNELGYDRHHEKAGRLYRLVLDAQVGDDALHAPATPAPLARTLVAEFPEVETAARLDRPLSETVVQHEDRQFREDRFFFADSTLFDVFTLPLVQGDPATALSQPNTVVLTQSAARKYFGNTDPLGQTLVADETTYEVTGVTEDPPPQTHFHFDFLASFVTLDSSEDTRWLPLNYWTYAVLREGTAKADVEARLPGMVRTHMAADVEEVFGVSYDAFQRQGNRLAFYLQSVPSIHLHSNLDDEIEPNGDATYVYLFAVIAVLVLLVACVNFMNLATARSARRAREVGLRKVLGSDRRQLIAQFLGESGLMSLLAVAVAVGLVVALLPLFNDLTGKAFGAAFLLDGRVWLGLLGFALVVGVIAGSYPAFYLSAFRPAVVLRGGSRRGGQGASLRNALVVFQFATSMVLIVGALVVYDQLDYVQSKRLGFDKEHVVVVDRFASLREQRTAFKQDVLDHAGVTEASSTVFVPGDFVGTNVYQKPGDDRSLTWKFMAADADFAETMRLEVVQGRDFSDDFATDTAAVLVNEAAAQALGWDDPVGRELTVPVPEPTRLTIIGVVRDFHVQSLHSAIQPLVIHSVPGPMGSGRVLLVRLQPEQVEESLAYLEARWNAFAPGEPFAYSFLDQELDALYRTEQRTGMLFGTFAGLAILIACLGLLGLAAFMAEQRTREIGVRKVLGATVPGIVLLLSRDFVKLVGIGFVIAVPLAYGVMSRWLEGFAYRTDLSATTFLLVGALALAVALVTVSYQAIKAALADPVKALRYE